jgi:hypothetical protein
VSRELIGHFLFTWTTVKSKLPFVSLHIRTTRSKPAVAITDAVWGWNCTLNIKFTSKVQYFCYFRVCYKDFRGSYRQMPQSGVDMLLPGKLILFFGAENPATCRRKTGARAWCGETSCWCSRWELCRLQWLPQGDPPKNRDHTELLSHRVGRVLSVSPVVGIGTPPPLYPQASVPPHPLAGGGEGTLACG